MSKIFARLTFTILPLVWLAPCPVSAGPSGHFFFVFVLYNVAGRHSHICHHDQRHIAELELKSCIHGDLPPPAPRPAATVRAGVW